MNCFSRGREVRRRCKSVPRSSVTEKIVRKAAQFRGNVIFDLPTYMSSRGEMKISLRLMTCCLFSGDFQKSRKKRKNIRSHGASA
jgi:hypothetical protein